MKVDNIVFNNINLKFIFFYKILQKIGYKIFYINEKRHLNILEINLLKRNNINQIDLSRFEKIKTKDWSDYWIGEECCIEKICNSNFSEKIKKILKERLRIKNDKLVDFFLFENTFSFSIKKKELIKIFSKNKGKSIFISFDLNDYFIEKNNFFKKIVFPINLFPKINNLKNFLLLILNSFFSKLKIFNKKKLSNENIQKDENNHKLIYLMHKGNKSVNNYKNIIIDFEKKKKDLFLSEQIIILDYTNYDINSKNYKVLKISNLNTNFHIFANTFKILILMFFRIKSLKDLFLIIKLSSPIYGYFKFKNFLNHHPNLKAAFIDFDFLCPKYLILSLNSKNIKTFSYQERPITSYYNNISFSFDYYFTTSKFFSKKINSKKNFDINQTIETGFYDLENLNFVKNNFEDKKNILFLNFQSSENHFSKKNNLAISDRSHKKFLYDLLKIIKKFPYVNFSVSSKGLNFFQDKNFSYFFNKINKINNVKLIALNDNVKTLDLIKKNDLVIGKPSSIMEKCLYIGKPLLIHEYSNNITNQMSQVINLYNDFFYCNSFEDLFEKISMFINNTNEFNENLNTQKKKIFGDYLETRKIIYNNINNF